ncbi:transglutaminase-like cysteine peptidase [Alcaligenaceae bacterium]|nr:transglutaminase-like cysteine peptidase [Alcaligenaceae bacterium]
MSACCRNGRHLLLAVFLAAACLLTTGAPALEFDAIGVQNLAAQRYGAAGKRSVTKWLHLLQLKGLSTDRQLRRVNTFWNEMVMGTEDLALWSREDYWATPLETLGRRAGDCEDYVIGKYFSLIHMGVPEEKLRFIYVRLDQGGSKSIAHMILGYYATPESEPLILDSLTDSIRPASQRRDLKPVFSFNLQGIYIDGPARANVERIGRWRDLKLRMQQQGLAPSSD